MIGFENVTPRAEKADPDDIGIDQAMDPRFPFPERMVQTSVFERCRGLGGKKFQDSHSRGCKHARSKIVFEIQQGD